LGSLPLEDFEIDCRKLFRRFLELAIAGQEILSKGRQAGSTSADSSDCALYDRRKEGAIETFDEKPRAFVVHPHGPRCGRY